MPRAPAAPIVRSMSVSMGSWLSLVSVSVPLPVARHPPHRQPLGERVAQIRIQPRQRRFDLPLRALHGVRPLALAVRQRQPGQPPVPLDIRPERARRHLAAQRELVVTAIESASTRRVPRRTTADLRPPRPRSGTRSASEAHGPSRLQDASVSTSRPSRLHSDPASGTVPLRPCAGRSPPRPHRLPPANRQPGDRHLETLARVRLGSDARPPHRAHGPPRTARSAPATPSATDRC